ncbi:MAG: delta-60 repeat domain-containing protein [Naasia sp.]
MRHTKSSLVALVVALSICAAPAMASAAETDGRSDVAYNSMLGAGFGATTFASAVVEQADGSVVLGGNFDFLAGAAVPFGLVRLSPDGRVDGAFASALGTGFDAPVSAVAQLADGSLLVGGAFTTLDGVDVPDHLVLLRPDGTLDTAFAQELGTGFDRFVDKVAAAPDGDLIIAGRFTSLDGVDISDSLTVLDPSGAVDPAAAHALGTGFSGQGSTSVLDVAVAPSGAVVVAGTFTELNGLGVPQSFVRLNPDHTVDDAFASKVGMTGIPGAISVDVLPDGRILVGGFFTAIAGEPLATGLARLQSDGSVDLAFSRALGTGFDLPVADVDVQDDGKIVAAGIFTTLDGRPAGHLVRLLPDGRVDPVFATNTGAGADFDLYTVVVARSGGLWVAGRARAVDGVDVPDGFFRLLSGPDSRIATEAPAAEGEIPETGAAARQLAATGAGATTPFLLAGGGIFAAGALVLGVNAARQTRRARLGKRD